MQRGKNKTDIQQMNRSLVIRTIQKNRHITRVGIAKLTGLNQATVTNIVGDLIEGGVVKEAGLISGKSGRRSIMLELAEENFAIIGVRLTRRHFGVGMYDIYGKCQQYQRFPIGLYSPIEELLKQMIRQIKKVSKLCEGKEILGIGLALPGPYIKQESKIALLTERHEWQNVDIAKKLSEETGFRVITEHDAKAAVVAEWYCEQNYNENASTVCIMLGQGVGAGIIENGRLLMGGLGIAGEIGHMSICYDGPLCECGNRGCLETYCSTLAIQKKIREQLNDFPETICRRDATIEEIIQAYLAEDSLAVHVIDEAAQYLGYGIANIINVLNPGIIILGDELSKSGERFLNVVKESVRERVLPKVYDKVEIVLSNLSDSVLCGVCLQVVGELVKTPEIFMKEKLSKKADQNERRLKL